MNKKSQQKSKAANTIETAFNEENIHSLLEALNIGTFATLILLRKYHITRSTKAS